MPEAMPILRSLILRAAAAGGRLLPDSLKVAAYRLPLLSPGVRWVLTRAAPEGRVVVQVASGIARGTYLRLNLKTQKYYWLGTHEVTFQQALLRETRPGMTVYDVGAHVGFFTLGLARLVKPGGRVFAFEPLPENAQMLREIMDLNVNQAGNVQLVEAAVSHVSGRIKFYRSFNPSLGCLTQPARGLPHEHEVESLTLDEYVLGRREPPPHLLKVDIEGAEGMALAGASYLLREVKPIWILEVHGQEPADKVWHEFMQANYRMLSLDRAREFKAPCEFARNHVLAVPR